MSEETLYKVTKEDHTTYNKTLWGPEVTHEVISFRKVCGPGCIHAYRSPELAAMLEPYHLSTKSPRLYKARGEVLVDVGDKVGCKRLTTVKEIHFPKATNNQRTALAILAALETSQTKEFEEFKNWATNWLSGKDISYKSARRVWMAMVAAMPPWSVAAMPPWSLMVTETVMVASNLSTTLVYAYRETKGKIDIPALARKAMEYE